MFMSQSLSGVPTASILRFMLCSIGDNITQLSLFSNSHTAPPCCTKTLKFFTLSLFCLFVTAHHVFCSLVALAKRRILVSTVALSKIFTPAKSIKSIGFVFLAKKSRVFSPYPARIHLLEVM